MKFLIFAASHRPESYNRKLAKLAEAHLAKAKITVDFAEYSEFDMPVYNDAETLQSAPAAVRIFGERAVKTHGIIICSPEYNWSYPGSIKNILDWTSRMTPNPLAGKTALLMSATPGSRGGITGLAHLKTPLEALQMFVFPRVLPLGNASGAFDDAGGLNNEKQRRLFTSIVDEYTAFTQKLSPVT